MDLTVCSYNCCSLNKNIDIVRRLADGGCDIIFLQETLVTETRLGDLNFIDENFNVVGSASVYSEKAIESNSGRSEGGLACMWRKDAPFNIEKISIMKDYIVLSVKIGSLIIVLVNVYLRSDIWEIRTLDAYLDGLSNLENILLSTNFNSIYFIGDFNADPFVGRAWGNLCNFMDRNNLHCFDKEILDDNSFTFVSYGDGSSKWLDHIVGRNSSHLNVKNVDILCDMIGSDHLPLRAHISVSSPPLLDCVDNSNNHNELVLINWEKLDDNDILEINDIILVELSTLNECEAMKCSKVGCCDRSHHCHLSIFHTELTNLIERARSNFVRVNTKRDKYKVIPGWNRNVRHLYSAYRNDYLNWVISGKERPGVDYERMKNTRKLFKSALEDCKNNKKREVSLSIQEKYVNGDMKGFWGDVQKKNNKIKYSEIIDGKSKTNDIIEIFTEKFLRIDNEVDDSEEESFLNQLKEAWQGQRKFYPTVSLERMRELIKLLKVGEGHDKIHKIFLLKMSDKLLQLICNFMNACYSHCFVPESLLYGDINPTIKDTKGNNTVSPNYRRVMQSSFLLKLFEIHVLDILKEKVHFNIRQFGYEQFTSTTDACLVLKETVNKYISNKDSKVYGLFVDLSKAFDKVDHFRLGRIFLERKLPPDLILFLMYYLRNQKARIVWKGQHGDYVQIEHGVRQGGILSPFLFKLYIDDVLNDISNSNIGCKLGILRLNILAYADDLVLLARTEDQLETLYKILDAGMSNLKLSINKSKTKCIIFHKKIYIPVQQNITLGNDVFEIVNEYKYLGHLLVGTLSDINDVNFRLTSFYGKFNWVFRNFNNISIDVFYFLFKSFCLPDYGLSLWNLNYLKNKSSFKTFNVAFSNALKKILNVPISTSSHTVAEIFNQLLFNHLTVFIQMRYFKRILNSKNPMIKALIYNIKDGYLYKGISNNLTQNYECSLSGNDTNVLKSRLLWVQNHEQRTGRPIPEN